MKNDDLILRQQQLLARSSALRLNLADQANALERPLIWADRVINGAAWLRQNPQWPIAAALLMILMRPRRAIRWGSRFWWGWQTFRRAQRWLHSDSIEF